MIEQITHPYNLQTALKRVISNKGGAGVDGKKVNVLREDFSKQKTELTEQLRNGAYLPSAIRGVEIPKGQGKTRLLGIPTVSDRLLQQAVSQVVMLKWESEFSPRSYGFRPNKSARQAVGKALELIHEGRNYIVDIDLKNFFDEVDHSLLLNLLHQKVTCQQTLRLIRKWLRAPILIKGKLVKRRKGVPQGGPLSPLLSNILLHELDKELSKRQLQFIRYADDFSIYTRTKSEAIKIKKDITHFLKTKLKLTINEQKSGIRRPVQFGLLGFELVPIYKKGVRGRYQLVASKKAWERLKYRLKTITRKTTPMSLASLLPSAVDVRIEKIKEVQRGWINYFQGASLQIKLRDLDGWLRNRIRYCIWHHWKKRERKRKNLIRLGINQDDAYAWSRTRMGGWAVAQSPILNTTITLKRLKQRGYESMLEMYLTANLSKYSLSRLFVGKPPYT